MKFSKSGKKRFKKKVKELKMLLATNEKIFLNVWRKQINGFLSEIQYRANLWRDGEEIPFDGDNLGFIEKKRLLIFDVLKLAETLLANCGMRAEQLVGAETRQVLEAECVRAISRVCDPHLDGSLIQHWFYQRAKV